MKKIYPILLVLLGAISAQAQNLQARLGSEVKFEKLLYHDKIIGVSGSKIYALASKLVKKPLEGELYAYFTVIDAKTMTMISSTPISVPDKKSTLLETMVIKGQPWIFTRLTSKKESIGFIKAYKLNPTTGEVNPKEYDIATFISKPEGKGAIAVASDASAYMVRSQDSTKIAVVASTNTFSEKESKCYVKVLDAKTMQPLWEQKIVIPFGWERYKISSRSLTNQGNFQILGKMYNSDKINESVSKTEAAFKYVVYEFDGTNTKGNDYILDLGGKFITTASLFTRQDNGNRVVAGLYSDKKNIIVNGLFVMEMDKHTGAVINKFMTTIESDKIKYVPKKIVEKKANGLTYMANVENVFFRKNGNPIVILDTDYSVEMTNEKGRTTGSYVSTNGNIAVGLTKKGDVEWATAIPRDYNSSFLDVAVPTLFFKNDCLFFVYNDSESNAKTPLDEKIKHSHSNKKGAIVLVKIDATGKMNRRMLLNEQNADGYFVKTADYVQTNANEYMFVARKYNLLAGKLFVKMCRMTFAD